MANWQKMLEDALAEAWDKAKTEKLRELWKSCTDYYGFPQLKSVRKLRKLSKTLDRFCNTKNLLPAKMADVIKAIEKEGLIDTVEFEYGKPKYLGFVLHPNLGAAGGSFHFKVESKKKFRVGFKPDENDVSQPVYQVKMGFGFFKLNLDGKYSAANPQFKTEEDINAAWKEMQKSFDIHTGRVGNITISPV